MPCDFSAAHALCDEFCSGGVVAMQSYLLTYLALVKTGLKLSSEFDQVVDKDARQTL